ncbi:golgi membrane protein [Rhodotorula toruloides]|uniref:Protein RER1 n=1 Tax=Rhodotorula toruloides TaxID=5286 RepID=A0A511K7Y7_RHOTO|nr:golgi membrane protein [Rhodotorula toruloides]
MDVPEPPAGANVVTAVKQYERLYQGYLDRLTPFTFQRWCASVGLFLLFALRILYAQAYYIVAYALGIYLLNLFLAFITPKFDPALAADMAETEAEEGAPGLPTSQGDLQEDGEMRPFIRRLPEFKFWHSATRAIAFSLIASFIPLFDVPVFWPILVMYFCLLTFITLRRQIAHMRKYKYLPFDIGKKPTYGH